MVYKILVGIAMVSSVVTALLFASWIIYKINKVKIFRWARVEYAIFTLTLCLAATIISPFTETEAQKAADTRRAASIRQETKKESRSSKKTTTKKSTTKSSKDQSSSHK